MVYVTLDFHEARRTDAYTIWLVVKGKELIHLSKVGKLVETTVSSGKTHWEEVWDLPIDTILVRIRRSNRGNMHYRIYRVVENGLEEIACFGSVTEFARWLESHG